MADNSNGKMIELERPPVAETAVLVRLVLPTDTDEEIAESLQEMRELAWTAGATVVRTFVQSRPKPDPATLIGQGKVEEVARAVEELEADLVVFDTDLTPTQGSKLADKLGVKVVDRTQLILDIFAQHATTNEGKLQVELAQLQYALPRLTGRGVEMMRQGAGIGTRGPGEQKLEVDRRVIRERIRYLRGQLDDVRSHRRVLRKRREARSTGIVALVGYTNAGKSSLLNAMTGADVLVENKLFATLDPRSRRCRLPSGREVVLTDTVGFIRKLPHSLVAAFRATLEETIDADLLLLVADAAHPAVEEHMEAVHAVLAEIGADNKSTVNVFNKIDIAEPDRVAQLMRDRRRSIGVSARTGEGLERLKALIDEEFASNRRRVRLRIPQQQAGIVSRVHENGRVLSQTYEDNSIVLEAELDPVLQAQLAPYEA
jgi:GTP-binding protein HflX